MPPRILLPLRLNPVNASSATPSIASAVRSFSSTTPLCKKKQSLAARYRDPFVRAQVLAAKAANISRQKELQEARQKSVGDPVRGVETPFVRSFDTALPEQQTVTDSMLSRETTAKDPSQPPPGPKATQEPYLNHFLSVQEVMDSFNTSAKLAEPSEQLRAKAEAQSAADTAQALNGKGDADLAGLVETREETERRKKNAELAIQRIVSLRNGSSRDRTVANVRRCVETFGRHYTDLVLSPKPASSHAANHRVTVPVVSDAAWESDSESQPLNPEWNKRAGPDTGSSEVQIAILTAKIRTLVKHMEGNGHKDKMNKRNLRLLVHKRQKHLKYLRKKERGGPRWQYVVEKLGVIDSMWNGEISL
ncbi:mitochondrial 37S ribosomal protein uS15m [Phyllosticta citriasiana]|uniref:Ribosomal protein S15 n=1 Tax=Phyllosticta citriasiana TaxID=595635 RepID=A0ABR1KM00_9PEZI